MVTIKRYAAEESCGLCDKNAEGVEVVFERGLSGYFCKPCFWRTLRMRSAKKDAKTQVAAPGTQPPK